MLEKSPLRGVWGVWERVEYRMVPGRVNGRLEKFAVEIPDRRSYTLPMQATNALLLQSRLDHRRPLSAVRAACTGNR